VRELVLTTLLALRFMATVLEEARNLAFGVAARGLDWRALGWRGGAGVAAAAAARLLANLMARAEAVALAMAARGFAGAEAHALHAEAAGGARGGAAQWAADAALLGAFAALCAACWAL
jgi:energy-coupling factor transporter transmembrane protein EcfT